MKKLLITTIALLLGMVLTTSPATAQVDTKFGVGLDYTSQLVDGTVGIQGEGIFGFSESFRAAADFSYYFPDAGDFWAINGNLHYVAFSEATTAVYGLAGVNYANRSFTVLGVSTSSSEVGFNIGAGAEFGVGFGNIYIEPKYVIGNADGFVGSAGVRFGL